MRQALRREWLQRVTRLLRAAGVLILVALAAPLLGATPARAVGPNAVTLEMDGSESFTVRAETEPELFAALMNEVQWLATGPGRVDGVGREHLGTRVRMGVLVDDVAKQAYDLYPLAAGGPRVCRPGRQPDGRRGTDAWFLARLTLPDTLRSAGLPLPGGPQLFSGNGGSGGTGGGGEVAADGGATGGPSFTRVKDFAEVVGAWRQVVLLNGAVVLVIAAGLAGISYLIRRKV
ncbi:hypothetical protein [Rhizomonospora bruguierae]|uniref:hypothetical protein n=1 Tax=Rhizomonospora bruguierae TaxID=1581705 RepID=UPI001BCF9D36|nr:hypothetical protein [Micromonospora sp. NBRC 107566]